MKISLFKLLSFPSLFLFFFSSEYALTCRWLLLRVIVNRLYTHTSRNLSPSPLYFTIASNSKPQLAVVSRNIAHHVSSHFSLDPCRWIRRRIQKNSSCLPATRTKLAYSRFPRYSKARSLEKQGESRTTTLQRKCKLRSDASSSISRANPSYFNEGKIWTRLESVITRPIISSRSTTKVTRRCNISRYSTR